MAAVRRLLLPALASHVFRRARAPLQLRHLTPREQRAWDGNTLHAAGARPGQFGGHQFLVKPKPHTSPAICRGGIAEGNPRHPAISLGSAASCFGFDRHLQSYLFPDTPALNGAIRAFNQNIPAQERIPVTFCDHHETLSTLPFARSVAAGVLPVGHGIQRYHDLLVHVPGYLAMPPDFFGAMRNALTWRLQRYDLAQSEQNFHWAAMLLGDIARLAQQFDYGTSEIHGYLVSFYGSARAQFLHKALCWNPSGDAFPWTSDSPEMLADRIDSRVAELQRRVQEITRSL